MVATLRRFMKKRRLSCTLAAIVLALGLIAGCAFWNLNPVLLRMAEARSRQLAVAAVNRAVAEVMGTQVQYEELMTVTTDADGRVTLIRANTLRMNDLASETALTAQRNLALLENEGVELPLGSALGIGLFSGEGPRIRVKVVPVGSVTTRFVTSFESAGINQTRHDISLEASVQMRIVIPTGADSVSVTTYVPIAQAIVVGEVPESYVNVPDTDSMLNMVP